MILNYNIIRKGYQGQKVMHFMIACDTRLARSEDAKQSVGIM